MQTETVKALGAILGRFVLVFNCDESFDFGSMGRIFVGLCQVWVPSHSNTYMRLGKRACRLEPGAALTSSIVWKSEFYRPFRSKYSSSRRVLRELKRGVYACVSRWYETKF
jgi:hypothetical protein